MRVSTAENRGPAADGRANLQGGLDQVGLPTLLTMVDMERGSGVLFIHRSGEVGRLWLRKGRVVRAQIDGRTRRTGKSAIFRMLAWSDGRFELTRDPVGDADEIGTPTTHLLMEAARKLDESAASSSLSA